LKGISYRISGEQEKLEKFLRMQIEVQGDVASVWGLARLLLLTGRLDESRELFKRVLEMDSSDLDSWIQLARLEQSSGNIETAIGYAGSYIEARPEDLAGKLLLGDLLMAAGHFPEARLQFEEAQLLDDPPVTPTLRLALLAMRQGEWAHARALIVEARSLSGSAQSASLVLEMEILLELRLGGISRAIELTETMFEFNRQFQPPVEQVFNYYVPIAQYHMMLGQLEQSESMLSAAGDAISPPLNHFLAFMEAILLAQKGEFEQAEAALTVGISAIEKFKAEYLAFQIDITAAEIARAKKEFSSAAGLYESAVEKALGAPVELGVGNLISVLYATGAQMYVEAGELDKAHALLDLAFERDDAEPSLWVARAMLQNASGDPQMALASINYALAIWHRADPDYVIYQQALDLRSELTAGL
jgi:tetratricopeptide (TPR) repeat protein